jgi:flagellar hook-associated protein 3 FlgL
MRVLFDVLRDGLGSIQTAADRMALAQHQLATGRRLLSVGTDPLAARQAVSEHATLGTLDAYTRTTSAATARLSTADSVLNGYIDKLSAAIVSGTAARGPSVDADARAALAADVRNLRDGLLSDLNTTFDGKYLFSGTNVGAPAYALVAGTWTYQGNADTVEVEVQAGRQVSVSFDGQAIAQGSDSADVFTGLDQLAAAIEAGDNDAIGVSLDALDRAFNRALRAQGSLGADERVAYDAGARVADLRRAAEVRRSNLEDANMAEVVTNLSQAETAYQAAISAVSRNERLTLLDFLR